MIREIIRKAVETAQKKLVRAGSFDIGKPPKEEFGDYAVNISKDAQAITEELKKTKGLGKYFKKVEFKPPVFINIFLNEEYLKSQVSEILKKKEKFGNLKIGTGKKAQVEFISANPTGPLTLGNGRGGFYGDVLSRVLKKAGYKVLREYYINDTGEQIKKLGHSVLGDSEAVYKGKYIEGLSKRIKTRDPEKAGGEAAKIILKEMIKPTVKKMGIKFNKWFSEKGLYKKGEIGKALEFLKKKNLVFEKDGALWFKSTQFGDDKDRVLIKESGEKTYFAADIAYLKNKIKRGFNLLVCFLGADHYGYVKRMEGAAQALGFEKENLKYIIMQLVHLFKDGQEVKMSKRLGTYVTIDELIDEVGLDITRFFFIQRDSDSHLNFDMNLAKEQSEKNPVYYVQYANARIHSILRKAQNNFQFSIFNFQLLKTKSELNLIKQLIRFPEVVEDTANDFQVQRLPKYAFDLADAFHKFYEQCQVLCEDKKLKEARLALVLSAKIVLKNTLDLMCISAPEKM